MSWLKEVCLSMDRSAPATREMPEPDWNATLGFAGLGFGMQALLFESSMRLDQSAQRSKILEAADPRDGAQDAMPFTMLSLISSFAGSGRLDFGGRPAKADASEEVDVGINCEPSPARRATQRSSPSET